MTLRDLADEKLLQLKSEILDTMRKVRNEEAQAIETLSEKLLALAETSYTKKTRCILGSLDFETRQSRLSDISDTERGTFQWIFDDNNGRSNQSVGFREWLLLGDNIYWISGKAGSGKSVLMNHIANDARTTKWFQRWAGQAELITARFFFWNAGSPMQKSQQGLLQSLLREIFEQRPSLVPIACPSRWYRYHDIGGTWSRSELKQAFKKLSCQPLEDLRFCFFVDGVDEYDDEDYTDIIDILKDLNSSPSVKICVSSRPWNIFLAGFGSATSQGLLVEDHNEGDIQKYVRHRFKEDERFTLLRSKGPNSAILADQIVQKAQGVFL